MGSASSKFRKYLQHGDEFAAMQVFQSSPELRKSLDPNSSYGDSHQHNTALHYAAKHGMKHLIRTFLYDLGGNGNKKNSAEEGCLHCVCQATQTKSLSAQERRLSCVLLILQWRGAVLSNGEREKVDLAAQDEKKNTALHYAAASGFSKVVEVLVSHSAPLFIENQEKQTPCDLAVKANHLDIAQFLESKMVFTDTCDNINEADLEENDDLYSGLRPQDLQEAKDQLLVETSDMLHIPLFTAEALLRDHEWSRETLLEKWMKDAGGCCESAGVQMPQTLGVFLSESDPLQTPSESPKTEAEADEEILCEICMSSVASWNSAVSRSCDHQFCTVCWENYLSVKIRSGDTWGILCPAFECPYLVPQDLIEKLVSPEMARRYLQFDIKAFVETNPSIKWCPLPGCGRAVKYPDSESLETHITPYMLKPLQPTSHAVDCGNGHFFCWECLGDAHAPSGCVQWKEWLARVEEVKPEDLKTCHTETEDAANCLWLVTHSKPCPNCKSPIQKNEGCNHMKCSKCKFDFCWVCLESWKKHSSATGGYFRCNRFDATQKADDKQGSRLTEARLKSQQMREMSRFVHFYTRFKNHENSHGMEAPLLSAARQKIAVLANSLSSKGDTDRKEDYVSFVEAGVVELLKGRRVLCGSYVYGYYLEDNGYNKTFFELTQNELEEATEKLSEMVARPYLQNPRSHIITATALVRRRRHELVRAVNTGLVPPDTPPNGKRRLPGVLGMDPLDDDEMTEALAASLRDIDPSNPWIKDGSGRHTNPLAKFDWPAEPADEDTEDPEINRALQISLLGACRRKNCQRPRARNPRTNQLHQFCSLACKFSAKEEEDRDPNQEAPQPDYNMDLLIALEMSRLQMIEDEVRRRRLNLPGTVNHGSGESSTEGPVAPQEQEQQQQPSQSMDSQEALDLSVAIQLSLQDTAKPGKAEGCQTGLSKESSVDNDVSDTRTVLSDVTDYTLRKDYRFSHEQRISKDSIEEGEELELDPPKSLLKTSADIAVEFFLKSLANEEIDFRNLNTNTSLNKAEKALLCFTTKGNEDGKFEIGDIHENGQLFPEDESPVPTLRRSQSTGDMYRQNQQEYSLQFDSDHAHDEPPDELARRHFLVSMGHSGSTNEDEHEPGEWLSLEKPVKSLSTFGIDSVKGSDQKLWAKRDNRSLLARRRMLKRSNSVCEDEPPEEPSKLKLVIERTESQQGTKVRRERGLESSDSTSSEMSTKPVKSPGLRIEISLLHKSDESSADLESETGIPKSPTLYISGVSICRSPDGCSPKSRNSSPGRSPHKEAGPSRNRSCSLVVPGTVPPQSPQGQNSWPPSPLPPDPGSPLAAAPTFSFPPVRAEEESESLNPPCDSSNLSSVLHVEEQNLSSDDFHEALFIHKSSSSRRRKSKKDRDKDNKKEVREKKRSKSDSSAIS